MKAIVHITLIEDDGNVVTSELQGEYLDITQERGIHHDCDMIDGSAELSPNGHQRASIKIWSGFPEWNLFQASS